MKGLYIHSPFCPKKCPYCDFYSLPFSSFVAENFYNETLRRIALLTEEFDTLYFGGGTPSLLGTDKINNIISSVNLSKNAEITLESNPNIDFSKWKNTKINRLSLGLQSANDDELAFLGRNHNKQKAINCIKSAKDVGIKNISLDLMIGTPKMTNDSLLTSIEFCLEQDVTHISSYILKIEENTAFYDRQDSLDLPCDERISSLYLFMVGALKNRGFNQYEISNFCKDEHYSRHNLKYWNCEEYSALGPSAHSFENGKRAFFPRDLDYYLSGKPVLFDSFGGDFKELAMLKLRLCKGLSKSDCDNFNNNYFSAIIQNTQKIPQDYINIKENNISLTPKGFLLSNAIIVKLLENI